MERLAAPCQENNLGVFRHLDDEIIDSIGGGKEILVTRQLVDKTGMSW